MKILTPAEMVVAATNKEKLWFWDKHSAGLAVRAEALGWVNEFFPFKSTKGDYELASREKPQI